MFFFQVLQAVLVTFIGWLLLASFYFLSINCSYVCQLLVIVNAGCHNQSQKNCFKGWQIFSDNTFSSLAPVIF